MPMNDDTNWLFIKVPDGLLSFVYDTKNLSSASYNIPFDVMLAFTNEEKAKELVKVHETYQVFRGQEDIGNVTIITAL